MAKIISLFVTFLMIIGICGCKSNKDDLSSVMVETIYEEIVLNESGNEIAKPQDNTNSDENITSSDTQIDDSRTNDTSSDIKPIEIDYNTVVEIDICGEIVRGYLSAEDATNQYHWLSSYFGQRCDHQHITLDWMIDLSSEYTVYFSENSDFSNPIIVKTNVSKNLKAATLIPGKIYYWKVIGEVSEAALGGGKIKIKDAPGRFIYLDGIRNVRDMGGWKTESGKTVKYGMLYRGAQLNTFKNDTVVNTIKASGLETFNSLNIKTEFDLRLETDVRTPAEGTNLNYISIANHTSYHNIFSKSNKGTVVSNYKTMFEYLSDSSNYPIYTHCQGGADRTGTYAFLLNGLLGVSYEDLTRDFELTSFAGHKRWRSAGSGGSFNASDDDLVDNGITVKWRVLYNEMMDYGAENGCITLSQSIEHWLVNYIGVPQSQIDSFKSIMLE